MEALLGSQLIHSRRLLFQMEPGLITTLPIAVDRVGLRRSLSTSALAATFPFTGSDLSQGRGLLYGVNPKVESPVLLDRFRLENHNAVLFATSGAGKSFFVKVELLRAFLSDIRVHVIDPEGEYAPIVKALYGSVVSIHPGAPVSLDAFAVALLAGGLSAVQRGAAVEEALMFDVHIGKRSSERAVGTLTQVDHAVGTCGVATSGQRNVAGRPQLCDDPRADRAVSTQH